MIMPSAVKELLRALPQQPVFQWGHYKNNKNGMIYDAVHWTFNANNGLDRWEVTYYKIEDVDRVLPMTRTPEHFLEKFTRA